MMADLVTQTLNLGPYPDVGLIHLLLLAMCGRGVGLDCSGFGLLLTVYICGVGL